MDRLREWWQEMSRWRRALYLTFAVALPVLLAAGMTPFDALELAAVGAAGAGIAIELSDRIRARSRRP